MTCRHQLDVYLYDYKTRTCLSFLYSALILKISELHDIADVVNSGIKCMSLLFLFAGMHPFACVILLICFSLLIIVLRRNDVSQYDKMSSKDIIYPSYVMCKVLTIM